MPKETSKRTKTSHSREPWKGKTIGNPSASSSCAKMMLQLLPSILISVSKHFLFLGRPLAGTSRTKYTLTEVIDAIKDLCKTTDAQALALLHVKFNALHFSKTHGVSDFIKQLIMIQHDITSIDGALDDKQLMIKITTSLPSTYTDFIRTWNMLAGTTSPRPTSAASSHSATSSRSTTSSRPTTTTSAYYRAVLRMPNSKMRCHLCA